MIENFNEKLFSMLDNNILIYEKYGEFNKNNILVQIKEFKISKKKQELINKFCDKKAMIDKNGNLKLHQIDTVIILNFIDNDIDLDNRIYSPLLFRHKATQELAKAYDDSNYSYPNKIHQARCQYNILKNFFEDEEKKE